MKPSELLRAAVPYLAKDDYDLAHSLIATRGLCHAVRLAAETHLADEPLALVIKEIRRQLRPHRWAEAWLASNGAPEELLAHSYRTINPAVQRWRAMWAEMLAQQFEARGE